MDHCEQNIELKDVTPNVVTKKSRGRPKLTDEEKQQRKEALKQYHKEYQKEYREQNKDDIRKYMEENKDKIRESQKKHYYLNKDSYINQNRIYRQKLKTKMEENNMLLEKLLTHCNMTKTDIMIK